MNELTPDEIEALRAEFKESARMMDRWLDEHPEVLQRLRASLSSPGSTEADCDRKTGDASCTGESQK